MIDRYVALLPELAEFGVSERTAAVDHLDRVIAVAHEQGGFLADKIKSDLEGRQEHLVAFSKDRSDADLTKLSREDATSLGYVYVHEGDISS